MSVSGKVLHCPTSGLLRQDVGFQVEEQGNWIHWTGAVPPGPVCGDDAGPSQLSTVNG